MNLKIIDSAKDVRNEPVTAEYYFQTHWLEPNQADPYSYKRFLVRENDGGDIARFELDMSTTREHLREGSYNIPESGPRLLQIKLIDIKESFRARGVGTQIIRRLEDVYSSNQLVALARPGSEGFWRSVGWTHITHSDPPRFELFASSRTVS